MLIIYMNKYLYIIILLFLFIIIYKCFENKQKNYIIKKSNINGVGIFANTNIKKDNLIDLVFTQKLDSNNKLYSDITQYFGSKLNHCYINNNAYLKNIDNKFYLYAKKNIQLGNEITVNYNNTPNTIKKAEKHYVKC